MCGYEEFLDNYKLKNILMDFRRDIPKFRSSGTFTFWIISLVAFVAYFIGALIKGWASLIFLLSALPLIMAWSIYAVREPDLSTFKSKINNYLNDKFNTPEWESLCNYITFQYACEDSKALWISGFGFAWLCLAVGQFLSFWTGHDNLLNYTVTSIMVQSAMAIIAFLYFVDSIFARRKTRIHMALKDIKRFQTIRNKELHGR